MTTCKEHRCNTKTLTLSYKVQEAGGSKIKDLFPFIEMDSAVHVVLHAALFESDRLLWYISLLRNV